MAKPDTALAAAAAEFDEELTAYTRASDVFLKAPLSSVKQLERANQALAEIASSEERLQAAGKRMASALAASRSQQEQLAGEVVARVPVVQARNRQLNELMAELTAVAGEVGNLNNVIASHRDNGDATRPPTPPTAGAARDVSATVFALSERAERLSVSAREAEFEELATQAHALHQRLQTIGKKLQRVADTGGA
jgi:DNA repair exonuclease SbcCD ATPase subunit